MLTLFFFYFVTSQSNLFYQSLINDAKANHKMRKSLEEPKEESKAPGAYSLNHGKVQFRLLKTLTSPETIQNRDHSFI